MNVLIATIGALVTIVLMGTCTHGPEGIFASIEQEVLIAPSDLGENLTINGMTRIGSTYYVATGRLNKRSIDSSNWNTVPHPPQFGAAIAVGVGTINDNGNDRLFVALLDADSLRSGLYELDPADDNWGSPLYLTDNQIVRLIVANDRLFVVERKRNRTYDLIHIDTGGAATPLLADRAMLVDGDYLPAMNEYIFIGVAKIIIVDGASLTSSGVSEMFPSEYIDLIGDATVADNENFGGLLVVPGAMPADPDTIYISSHKGRLFRSEENGDADTWSRITAGSSNFSYTDMVHIPQLDGGVVIGVMDTSVSEGGYMELPGGAGSIRRPGGGLYRSSDMRVTTVGGFFVDEERTPAHLFVFTFGKGLWRAEYGSRIDNIDANPAIRWE